jgi:hypothetical protein
VWQKGLPGLRNGLSRYPCRQTEPPQFQRSERHPCGRDSTECVLELVPTADALQEPFLIGTRLYALNKLGLRDEAISPLASAVDRYPQVAGLMVELARAYLVKRREPDTSGNHARKAEALDLAIRARQIMQRFRLDAGEAVEMACQAASCWGSIRRRSRWVALLPQARQCPRRPRALTSTACRTSSIAKGRPSLGTFIASFGAFEFSAECRSRRSTPPAGGAPTSELQAAYDQVWNSPNTDDQRTLYWVARVGVKLRGLTELATRTDDTHLLVETVRPGFDADGAVFTFHAWTLIGRFRGLRDDRWPTSHVPTRREDLGCARPMPVPGPSGVHHRSPMAASAL